MAQNLRYPAGPNLPASSCYSTPSRRRRAQQASPPDGTDDDGFAPAMQAGEGRIKRIPIPIKRTQTNINANKLSFCTRKRLQ